MRLVIIESPYAGDVQKNVEYARACVADSLQRGEAPIASHLLYTQEGILNDDDQRQRNQGIGAGLAWLSKADATVVYVDLGLSEGMMQGMRAAIKRGVPVECRILGVWRRLDLAGGCGAGKTTKMAVDLYKRMEVAKVGDVVVIGRPASTQRWQLLESVPSISVEVSK